MPNYSYLIEKKWDEFTVNINRGRGCNRECTFCAVPSFYFKSYRQMSNENLFNEIKALVYDYNVNYFTFIDDVFYLNSDRSKVDTIELARKIKNSGLKIKFSIAQRIDAINTDIIDELICAGLCRIFIGFEATSQKILKKLDKKISIRNLEKQINLLINKNIDVECSFINFLPFNTLDDIRENISFFSQWGLDILRSIGNKLEPNPGTKLYYDLMKESNLIRDGFNFYFIKNKVDARVDTLSLINR